jgi:hypothetical protein
LVRSISSGDIESPIYVYIYPFIYI